MCYFEILTFLLAERADSQGPGAAAAAQRGAVAEGGAVRAATLARRGDDAAAQGPGRTQRGGGKAARARERRDAAGRSVPTGASHLGAGEGEGVTLPAAVAAQLRADVSTHALPRGRG